MNSKDYFASLWIANLGVVPLFSLAFFLLAPAFFLFNFLLILVCVVFEDISKSLLSYFYNYNRGIFLSIFQVFVKMFLALLLCGITQNSHSKDIFISKGEQLEISALNLSSFSVGNKEVLKYKYLKSKGKIFIKGKSLGFSDLIIWNKKNKKETYQFYVTSKRDQLKIMSIAQSLQGSGLVVKIQGDIIKVSGDISRLDDLLLVKTLRNRKNENLILNIKLNYKLKNFIIKEVYKKLNQLELDGYFCEVFGIDIDCFYKGTESNLKKLNLIEMTYGVKLSPIKLYPENSNFVLNFNILSFEENSTATSDSGFNKIDGELKSLLHDGKSELVTGDFFFLNGHQKIKLIGKPKVIATIDSPFHIELGKEIPVHTKTDDQVSITWKFIGLKITGKLKIIQNKLKIAYSYSYTYGGNDSVSGPKGKSQVYMGLNEPINLFKIKFNHKDIAKAGVPGLKNLPLIGSFFTEEKNQTLNQNISVYLDISQKE